MSLKILTDNIELAWKLYNYLNIWEGKIFGKKTPNNASNILIVTLVAFYEELSLTEISLKSGVKYADLYRYVDSLTKYFKLLDYTDGKYRLSKNLVKSVHDSNLQVSKVNEKIFCTVLSNMKYHTKIFQEHLDLKEETGKFKMVRAMLNPVISNPIKANDFRKLSLLGYMKYKPQNKELKLNAVAYEKDWVGVTAVKRKDKKCIKKVIN